MTMGRGKDVEQKEEIEDAIIRIVKEYDGAIEPWVLVDTAVEETGRTRDEVRRVFRLMTHERRSERRIDHILDGRIEYVGDSEDAE